MERNRVILGVMLLVFMAGFIGVVAVIRSNRQPKEVRPEAKAESPKPERRDVPAPPSEPEAPVVRPQVAATKQGAALHDATLLGLIQNAKVAQQRGDLKTRDAMLAGLKKQPERSKELLEKEISSAKDSTVAYALQTLMKELQ